MSGVTTSYTTVSTIPQTPYSGRVVDATIGLYTCPANKKATVIGRMILDAVGADASYAIAVKRGLVYFPIGEFVTANKESRINGSVTLEAGDILTNIGDSGSTNGTCDIDISVQEVTV